MSEQVWGQLMAQDRRGARTAAGFGLSLIVLLLAMPSSAWTASNSELIGEIWDVPESHGIYLAGTDEFDVNLSRSPPDAPGSSGSTRFISTTNSEVIRATSQPATTTMNITGNLSVQLYAALDSSLPIGNCFGSQTTRFFVSIEIEGQERWQGETPSDPIQSRTSADPQEFLIEEQILDIVIPENATIELVISVEHLCNAPARLYWGGFQAPSGLQFHTELVKPNLTFRVDDLAHPRLELQLRSPWMQADVIETGITIFGPLESPEDAFANSRADDLEVISIRTEPRERILVDGSTAQAWWSERSLSEGDWVAEIHLTLIDGGVIDGIIHVRVDGGDSSGFSASWVIIPILTLTGIGWMIFAIFSKGLPLQLGLGHLTLVLLMLPLVFALDPLGARPEPPTASPSLRLLSHSNDTVTLDSLLDGKEALVLGVVQAGSSNDLRQVGDLIQIQDLMRDRVQVAQLITGAERTAEDINAHATYVDGAWPILIDETGETMSRQLPTGSSDGVIVIDPAGNVILSRSGSAGTTEVEEVVTGISSGSGYTPLNIFTLLWIAGPAILCWLLPQRVWTPPEKAIIPGSTIAVDTAVGMFGAGLLIIPLTIAGAAGLSGPNAPYLDIVGGGILCLLAGITAWKGSIPGARKFSNTIHNRLEDALAEHIEVEKIEEALLAGIWLSCALWISSSEIITVGILGAIVSGGSAFFLGMLILLLCLFMLGILVATLRFLGSLTGSIGRIFGRWWAPGARRLYAALLVPSAAWLIIIGIEALLS